MQTILEERVERGMALLDSHYGPQWDGGIDTDRLDIGSPMDCVLGQLEGIYSAGMDVLWPHEALRLDKAIAHGFDTTASLVRDLNDIWKEKILAHRKARRPFAA